MPRVMIKGVIWNKIQDDILKAGVMRYGNNQWERIIPLLPGKTIRQCKDRWEIGLSQNARRTQWTRREDDKLLRLVILMPAKWQNIASIIGRTAVDCFNRYDCLLTRAQEKLEEDDEVVDPKKLVPGRIYRNPGVKPAFMDLELSLENGPEAMMSEARAKLASTQAKKAKLLAREKRLEVARRFAYVRRQRQRIRARLQAEEIGRRSATIDLANSSESQSNSSYFCYSSTGHVDPLTEMFLEMQRRTAKVEPQTRPEDVELPQDEQTTKRRREIAESVAMFLANENEDEDGEAPKKRRKVIVLREPSIAYEDLQQVVELRRHLESAGHITSGRNFADGAESCRASSVREARTEINGAKLNDASRQENNNFCIQSVV